MDHLERENRTMGKMVEIYCRDHHNAGNAPCDDCAQFLNYAEVRLEKCPYGENKPTCANCPVHCYKPHYRAQAKAIMRYSGPRMLLRHPLLTLAHFMDGRRRALHPRELTREQRLEKTGRYPTMKDRDG